MKTKFLNTSVWVLPTLLVLFTLAISSCQKDEQRDATEVFIQNMMFTPGSITVEEGTIVKWVNKDDMTHDVVSDNGLFDSGNISSDDVYMHQFNTPGTYSYTCTLHPGMNGSVIVRPSATP